MCSSETDAQMKISIEHWWCDMQIAVRLNYIDRFSSYSSVKA
jgi:hypothetical protein